MSGEKQKRLIIATTVGAVLLLVVLLCVMIFQIISLAVNNGKKSELKENIARLEQLIESADQSIEVRSERWWIEQRLRELGYVYPGDSEYGK